MFIFIFIPGYNDSRRCVVRPQRGERGRVAQLRPPRPEGVYCGASYGMGASPRTQPAAALRPGGLHAGQRACHHPPGR